MRWTAVQLLRPIVFVLAIIVAAVVGDRTDSFWLGFLAFFIAMSLGRVVRALARGEWKSALQRLVWPGSAIAYAFLFDGLGLWTWATFFVTIIAASLTRAALAPMLPQERRWTITTTGWRRIDLDELLP